MQFLGNTVHKKGKEIAQIVQIATGSCNFFSLWKTLLVLIYSKLHSKSCDFCTPQDAGVVKDARVWVTSNKLPTAKSN